MIKKKFKKKKIIKEGGERHDLEEVVGLRMANSVVVLLIAAAALFMAVGAEDPYLFFTWKVSYGTAAPLGVPQRVILVNGQFPGPDINSTTNNNLVINVFNDLDEPFLFSWYKNGSFRVGGGGGFWYWF